LRCELGARPQQKNSQPNPGASLMKPRVIGVAMALSLVISLPAVAQKVRVDFDKAASFANFKTYAWKEGTPAKNPLIQTRITSAIEKELAAKGFMKVDAEQNPDLVVLYHAAVDIETQINTVNMGGYYGWYGPYGGAGGGGTSTTYVDKIPVGTLRVDIGEVKNKKLLWQGTATSNLSDKPEKVEKTINKSAEKMFKDFPPDRKKK
jgi:hypothetical protein